MAEVIQLGLQAGVPKGYIDELLALGLVVMAAPMQAPPVEPSGAPEPLLHAEATLPPVPAPSDDDDAADTRLTGLPLSNTEMAALDVADPAFAQARSLLLDLLREHGPVSTTVTMLRVRRARDRSALLVLLPDIRGRLTRAGLAPALLQRVDQAEGLLSA